MFIQVSVFEQLKTIVVKTSTHAWSKIKINTFTQRYDIIGGSF